MKNNKRIIYGILLTIVVFAISTVLGRTLNLNIGFIPFSFITHSLMLILSVSLIYGLKKYVNYKISFPRFKEVLKPILFGLITTIIINIFMTIIITALGEEIENHIVLTKMSPTQIFVFVFIYASIAEELLFRGFLMNILKPLKSKGLTIFKRNISLPVIISGVAFGFGHLILITTGASIFFLIRVVVFTTTLGLIAGYYQEKYDNNAFAIIVHMSGNIPPVISSLIMNVNT